jgi:hypothetical protein
MEKKESKSSKHFWLKITKLFFRLLGCFVLAYQDFVGAAVFLAVAEVLAIIEEF